MPTDRNAEFDRTLDQPTKSELPVNETTLDQAKVPNSLTDEEGNTLETLIKSTGHRVDDPTRSRLQNPLFPEITGYLITSEIARGGMGCVYAAEDLSLRREVAIKTLLPTADSSRFVVEAEITARLPHPNIPPVYALGMLENGSPYLVMKLVRGDTLKTLLDQRNSPKENLSKFVQIFEQIAQGVGFAHAQSVIHRDLKPQNVMVGAFGEVQVMDWGLAKELHGTEPSAERPMLPSLPSTEHELGELTQAGAIMGTPQYMAPEQARGEKVDARADVFSLGSVLTLILTGQPAFVGKNAYEVVDRAAKGDLSEAIARLDACDVDSELVELAKQSLAVDPDDRPRDALQIAKAISNYRTSVESRLQQAKEEEAANKAKAHEQAKRRKVIRYATGAIAAVLILGVIGTTIGFIQARQKAIAEEQAKSKAIDLARIAQENEDEAKKQAKIANDNEIEAKKQTKLAEIAANDAKSQLRRAEAVVGYTSKMFQSTDATGLSGIGLLPPSKRSRTLSVLELLQLGSVSVKDQFKEDPLTRAALLDVLGDVNRSVGNKEIARGTFKRHWQPVRNT